MVGETLTPGNKHDGLHPGQLSPLGSAFGTGSASPFLSQQEHLSVPLLATPSSAGLTKKRPRSILASLFTLYLFAALTHTFYATIIQPVISPETPTPTTTDDLLVNRTSNRTLLPLKKPTRKPSSRHATHAHAAHSVKKPIGSTPQPTIERSVAYHPVEGVEWGKASIDWYPNDHERSHRNLSADSPESVRSQDELASERELFQMTKEQTTMSEDFFLSKAFGEALQPSKIIPYYYRAQRDLGAEDNKRDITITTLVTANRFKVLTDLVEKYQGPVSVCIHVVNIPAEREELLTSLRDIYESHEAMKNWVDVHLVIDNFDRQFNMWRNVAKYFARTDYVMMLDVDFWICTDFRHRILASPDIIDKLSAGTAAFVVPAFEFTKQVDGLDSKTFPTEKKDLLELVEGGKIGMFHKSWAPGHGSTNYTRFYESKEGEIYRVHGYTHSYEPYIIYKREGTPYCDERFIGYGGNKAACLYELFLSGVSFWVLPDDFLIHQSHAYAEKARKHERRYNRKLFIDYRESLCFRLLTQFVDSGDIATDKSKNLMQECKKIKGFSAAAQRLITAST
ncbi:glycosyltransferase family 49 protein [Mixia osmundae IAM 14324]|uniref:Glycosyltransferase family 49 protein n=1 Tax=Mixia osmundae (strain CBS 9802 / IAM 14324 / JCM 22182 / KY 12970) TaxID=764103 RepID=G7DSL8_MIXOS|nr:glycosyltransferase family 49 protein [Mixia osmundae IAM 14324]KEI37926.1 glycosyltransferase family 49 protein [Mixia osmundae IAM 14324]GAA93578.1 hypothetical protein E5Q_00222 [Mixia osmundae IAM 14324]